MILKTLGRQDLFGSGGFRPLAQRRGGPLGSPKLSRLSQGSPWVEVRPNVTVNPNIDVKAPINIELGSLPLSLGLFVGSGVAFLSRTSLPEGWPQTVAALSGAGLAVAGIANLVLKKPAPAEAPKAGPVSTNPQVTSPVQAAPATASGQTAVTGTYTPPTDDAVTQVTGHISYPAEGDTVSLFPWQSSYTVRVELHNPMPQPVTLDLVAEAMEDPQSDASKEKTSSNSLQVTIGPGEVKSVDVPMSSQAWGFFVAYVDVVVNVKKRAWAGAPAYMVDARSFVIK